jgi:hypothetical protein
VTIMVYFADGVLDEVRKIRFSDFRISFQNCARQTNISIEVKAALSSLLTLNFQTFKKSQLQTAGSITYVTHRKIRLNMFL